MSPFVFNIVVNMNRELCFLYQVFSHAYLRTLNEDQANVAFFSCPSLLMPFVLQDKYDVYKIVRGSQIAQVPNDRKHRRV